MLRLASAGQIKIECPLDIGTPKTVFTLSQITAEDWDAFVAAGERQVANTEGEAGARARKQQIREVMLRYCHAIENGFSDGDNLTAIEDRRRWLGECDPTVFTWLLNCMTGMAQVSAYEKKASPSPCEPSQSSSGSTKKAASTTTTVEPAASRG